MSKHLKFILLSVVALLLLSIPLYADYSESGLVKGLDTPSSELSGIDSTIPTKPRVHYLSVEGAVTPVMAEFIVKSIDDATKDSAEFIVIELDTPGGLDLSMRIIIKSIMASEVPVVVYVGPAGARAASAGVFISFAAHVAAMTPGTNIGSAHPVAMGGGKMDETMMAKVENDAAAYIMGLAAKRGRNAEWAEKAVRDSVNITAEEAFDIGVIDVLANDRGELFLALHGRAVETITGVKTLRANDAEIKEVNMNLRSQILNAISDPNVAYILMMLGMMGLYFELSNPGVIFPGVVGAICLILAFYSFQTLPVSYAGLLLIALAVIFFIAEIKITSFGLLSVAGVISLSLGSLMLFESPAPFMRVSLWIITPTVVVVSGFFIAMMYLIIKTYRTRPVSGLDALITDIGVASEDFGLAGKEGQIFIEGEYWRAVSEEAIKEGEHVKVVNIDGLILTVEKT